MCLQWDKGFNIFMFSIKYAWNYRGVGTKVFPCWMLESTIMESGMFKVQCLFVNIFLACEFVTFWNKKIQWTILNERHEGHSLSPAIAQAQLLHLARDHCASHAKHVYTFLHVELVFTQLDIPFHGFQIKYVIKNEFEFSRV